jgi:hypothetical protein
LQSCSFKFPDRNRGPSSSLLAINLNDYKVKMIAFKGRALGSERDANCSKAQLDEDFNHLMASLKKDSCAENNFSLDKEEFVQKNCPKIKKEGLFDRFVKKTIEEERANKPLTYFKKGLDPEFLKLIKEAQSYLISLNSISENEAYSVDDRIDLLAIYIENVLLPVRDLVVIKRSYLASDNDESKFYQNLLPSLPGSLVHGLSTEQLGLLTEGPNPGTTPFYMEIESSGDRASSLVFSKEVIRHDIVTLLKAPTSKNYVLALKWMTLHMMLSQVYLYDTILGTKSSQRIPRSCQNQFNGNLPSEFKFKLEVGEGDRFLENILAGNGLTFKNDDTAYLDYYIDNINKDPLKEGYSGLVPFENYKNAKMGLKSQTIASNAIRPQFDDVAHYQTIMGFKSNEALKVFRGTIEKNTRGSSTLENINYAGGDTFKNILGSFSSDEIAEITLPNGSIQQIYPGKQNLSPYLLETMKQYGFSDYSQLITEKLKTKFAGKIFPRCIHHLFGEIGV